MKKATIINLNRSIYYMNTDVIGKKDGFVIRLAKADDRYFFLIVAPDGEIIGENVLNEVDWNLMCANFRIGLYHQAERGKDI